jgi:hypothetical protein
LCSVSPSSPTDPENTTTTPWATAVAARTTSESRSARTPSFDDSSTWSKPAAWLCPCRSRARNRRVQPRCATAWSCSRSACGPEAIANERTGATTSPELDGTIVGAALLVGTTLIKAHRNASE